MYHVSFKESFNVSHARDQKYLYSVRSKVSFLFQNLFICKLYWYRITNKKYYMKRMKYA